ncbi:AMP-binding protein [Acidobacteriota bacterium]
MENEIKYTKTLADFLEEDKSQYPNTFNELLEYCVQKYADKPFVGKVSETPYTYKEFYARVLSISNLLLERGIKKGDRVAVLGENSPNWGISYFAILRAGASAVPILPDFPEADIRHILSDAETKVLFTTYKQWEKICGPDLDRLCSRIHLKHIIMLDDFDEGAHQMKMESLTDIFNKALDFIKKIPGTFGLVSHKISEDDIASIIYTSGTSGHAKAVMLTHKNLISNAISLSKLAKITSGDVYLSILPLPHCYEFTIGFLLMLISGARTVYLGKPPTPSLLEKACAAEKPHLMSVVPLILEKIYKKKVLPVLKKNLAVKFITKIPVLKKKIYKKINKKLIDFFGGRLRLITIGGAAFNREAEKFFQAAGFPYLVGYGLTETSPLLTGGPEGDKTIKVSSAGKVTPGCEIKILDADEKTGIGEIVARGPNVMKGYYKNPQLTAEVLDDEGWFKTGDLGCFDKYDNLYIKGRSKNVIVMSQGENIFPEAIEEKLNSCFHVLESLVIENNNQLEAWVYLDYDLIDRETNGKTEHQRQEYIEQILTQTRDEVNEQLSVFSKISKIIEQQEPFVKTATHKIKRYLYTHTGERR